MSEEMYERNLPEYLAHDLEAWKKGVEEKLSCLTDIQRQFYKTYLAARHEALFV